MSLFRVILSVSENLKTILLYFLSIKISLSVDLSENDTVIVVAAHHLVDS